MAKFGVHFSLLLGVIFAAVYGWAAESLNQSTLQVFRKPLGDKKLITRWDLSLTQTRYSGTPQIEQQGQSYSSLIPSFQTYRQWGSTELPHSQFYSEGLVVFPMSDGVDLNFALPELYYQNVLKPSRYSFSIGRKKQTWSELDSFWNLGLWQPLVRWDAANPIEQGLTGIYWQAETPMLRSVFFVSGLYLPDQQPSYEVKDGEIVSANRWFRAPVSTASLQTTKGDIKYDVQEPSAVDVVRQSSYALSAEFGQAESGPYLRTSYTDKPLNQFHLTLKGTLDIGTSDFSVPVVPMVVRHKVVATEVGWRGVDDHLFLSSNWEQYEKPQVKPGWEQTALIDTQYWGATYKRNLNSWGVKRSHMALGYVERVLADNKKSATIVQGDVEASTQRFQFDRMAALQLHTNLYRTYKRELDADLKYVYSLDDQGEWLQLGTLYRQDRRWYWNLSMDLFGVPAKTSASTSFISKFRGNDRLSGGVTYVF